MSFRTVDLAAWPRRDHFQLFAGLDHPYFSLTVDVDLTEWHRRTKAAGRPFFPSLLHAVTGAANAIEAFRTRVRGEQVVIHDRIDPSFTVPWREGLFNFCTLAYEPDRDTFLALCMPAIAAAEQSATLDVGEPGRDAYLYVSCLPWFAFSSMTHPVDRASGDSVPRIAWGRLDPERGNLAVNLQLHHGLADGRHVADFLQVLKAELTRP